MILHYDNDRKLDTKVNGDQEERKNNVSHGNVIQYMLSVRELFITIEFYKDNVLFNGFV